MYLWPHCLFIKLPLASVLDSLVLCGFSLKHQTWTLPASEVTLEYTLPAGNPVDVSQQQTIVAHQGEIRDT